jgi:pyruvate kinase
MKFMPKTKIIATLGPSSRSPDIIRKMMLAGMDVVRLNFSHGTLEDKRDAIRIVRELNRTYRRHIRVLGDLEGYRIRIGSLARPVNIVRNTEVRLTQKKSRTPRDIPFDYTGSLSDIGEGQEIYIDDGNLALKVVRHDAGVLVARVLVGGLLREHKGVNIPAARLRFKGLTVKDRENIHFCLEHNVDFIAQSFVRSAADMRLVRAAAGRDPVRLIAKIENRQGVRNLAGIMAACDGIMIARGDLGVSLPIFEVPLIQKEIVRKCRRAGAFSITATQMLESMAENLRPTRAEVSDVANAIIDGSDYLMLSAETAAGKYPVEAVRMMNQIAVFTENYLKSAKAIRCEAGK